MRWHVQRMGQGPVCLLLHGTGASTHTWRDVMPLLAAHYSVIAVDLPGHAFSHPLPHQSPSLPHMAQALLALLAQLQVRPALWVGHSAGATIAAHCLLDTAWLAQGEPGRLVALNPAWLPMPGSARWFYPLAAWVVGRNPLSGWLAAKQVSWARMADKMLAQTGSTIDAVGQRCYRYLLSQPSHARGVLQMMAAWNLLAFEPQLSRLSVQVQMQIGLADGTIPPSLADHAQTLLPYATRIDWPGLGHLAHEEKPQDCVAAMLKWAKPGLVNEAT
ncbi:MAG: Fluoroacetate dehalogenase [Pseudomonadota bacterium]|jgi:magnesium chelatase accessory protein